MTFLRVVALSGIAVTLYSQQSADRVTPAEPQTPEPQHKRLFGIVPNYRTSPSLVNYQPLTSGQKFRLASDDAFDRGTFLLAAAFAGEGQLTNANPSFGQGVKGYAHYLVTSYADWATGDFMTEAIWPWMLHQDPRYFRKGHGRVLSRLGAAAGQIFWTHTDSGGHMFNFSEIGGNATSVAISEAYYPDNRSAGAAVSKLAIQVAVDMSSNIMKEFYPDLIRALHRKHSKPATPAVH